MNRYTLTDISALTRADHAGRVEAYLQAQGFQTAGVVIRWDDETDRATVSVTANADPGAALAAYVPTLTPDEQARADVLVAAQDAIATIAAKAPEERTTTEAALLGLASAVPELAG